MKSNNKIHWVVIRHTYFTGNNYIVERRNKRKAADRAQWSLEAYADADEYMFYILRSDEAEKKGIK